MSASIYLMCEECGNDDTVDCDYTVDTLEIAMDVSDWGWSETNIGWMLCPECYSKQQEQEQEQVVVPIKPTPTAA